MALDAIEQLLVANHGFTVTPEGAVVSPSGQVRNVVDGKTTFTPYNPPTTEPTFAEQFAAQQAQAIADTNQVRQDEAIASGQDTYQSVATDGSGAVTDVSVGTPANLQEQILSVGQPTFSSGSPTQALPPASTQTREDLVSALGEATESDTDTFTYSGDKTGKTVTFDDGSVLTQKGYSFQYEDADGNPIELDTTGLKASSDSKNDALSTVVRGIKSDLTEDVYGEFGGEEGALVSEYLADEAAAAQRRAKSDERKDEAMFGEGGRMDQLNEQVQREADALGISTDAYYSLGMPLRGQMAISDIGELFTETPGDAGYFARVGPDGQPVDKDGNPVDFGGLGLGTLGSENIEKFKEDAPIYAYTDLGMSPGAMGGVQTGTTLAEGYQQFADSMRDTGVLGISGATGSGGYNPLAGGLNIPGTGLTITAGDPVGPGAGSNTGGGGPNVGGGGDTGGGAGGGDTGGGGIGVGVPVIGPGVIGGGTGGGDTGGGGIGGGVPVAGTMPDPSTYIVPSTANYGEDPRFANLAPTYNVSKAPMPIFDRNDPRLQPVQPIGLLAQGGIVSLQDGGDPSLMQDLQSRLGNVVVPDLDNLDELLKKGFITIGEYNFYKEKQQESVDNSFPYPEAFFASPEGDSELNNLPLEGRGFSVSPEVSPEQESMDEFQKLFRRKQSLERDPTGMVQLMAGGGSPANAFYIQVADTQLAKDNPNTGALYVIQQADKENPFLSEDTRYQIGMVLMGKGHSGRGYRHGGVAERGYSHDGVGSLSDTARNMFRPMVS